MSSPSAHAAPSDLLSVRLAALRSELDRVDDALHDGLMRRAALVSEVAALRAKGPVPLRPGREAAIIRRLLARNHGALDPALLVRIWREMISGFTVHLQQAMRVAVDDANLAAMVTAHFGLLTPVETVDGAAAAMAAVSSGRATVAVLRWPGDWWVPLLDERPAMLHVVARLPLFGSRADLEAMVLTRAPPDPSGDDKTLLATPVGPRDMAPVLERLRRSGLARIISCLPTGPCLVETNGFIASDDPLLSTAPGGFSVVGAYATQDCSDLGETR